jgi:putative SOS response-associated peptidase YedK
MCGRFAQAYTWEQLVALYRLTMPPVNTQPSYNVCPTDQIDLVMLDKDGGRAFTRARWGLIPCWWSKPLKQVPATFNARSYTVATKPMFRDAFRRMMTRSSAPIVQRSIATAPTYMGKYSDPPGCAWTPDAEDAMF